jgi:hypothetical protein
VRHPVLIAGVAADGEALAGGSPGGVARRRSDAVQNKQVTGSWTTLPYALSEYQYGVPAALTFQANAAPHRELTREQELDYKMQLSFRG